MEDHSPAFWLPLGSVLRSGLSSEFRELSHELNVHVQIHIEVKFTGLEVAFASFFNQALNFVKDIVIELVKFSINSPIVFLFVGNWGL